MTVPIVFTGPLSRAGGEEYTYTRETQHREIHAPPGSTFSLAACAAGVQPDNAGECESLFPGRVPSVWLVKSPEVTVGPANDTVHERAFFPRK
jgi:hypothetical protein